MGYEAAPFALGDFLRFVSAEYGRPKIYVTENGVCDNTAPAADGKTVPDVERTELLRGFIAGMHAAIAAGVNVRAYYVWSLLDNFEWAFGYSKRFGIVWTDFATQARIPKQSAAFFSEPDPEERAGGVIDDKVQAVLDAYHARAEEEMEAAARASAHGRDRRRARPAPAGRRP